MLKYDEVEKHVLGLKKRVPELTAKDIAWLLDYSIFDVTKILNEVKTMKNKRKNPNGCRHKWNMPHKTKRDYDRDSNSSAIDESINGERDNIEQIVRLGDRSSVDDEY